MLTPFKLIIPANFANVDQSFDINDLGPALSLRTTVDCSKLRAQNSFSITMLDDFFPRFCFRGLFLGRPSKIHTKMNKNLRPTKKTPSCKKLHCPNQKMSLEDSPRCWMVRLLFGRSDWPSAVKARHHQQVDRR